MLYSYDSGDTFIVDDNEVDMDKFEEALSSERAYRHCCVLQPRRKQHLLRRRNFLNPFLQLTMKEAPPGSLLLYGPVCPSALPDGGPGHPLLSCPTRPGHLPDFLGTGQQRDDAIRARLIRSNHNASNLRSISA